MAEAQKQRQRGRQRGVAKANLGKSGGKNENNDVKETKGGTRET